MDSPPRRVFLRNGLSLSGSLLLGCTAEQSFGERDGGDGPTPRRAADGGTVLDSGVFATDRDGGLFAAGVQLGEALFIGESEVLLEQVFNEGLDGRLYTDLSKLEATEQVTPNEAFYVRTRRPDLLMPQSPWTVRVITGAETSEELLLSTLQAAATPQGVHLMECSGNARGAAFGLLSSAEWSGVPLLQALADFTPPETATSILVSGFDEHSQPSANNHSTPGASWIFRFTELEQSGAFLATQMNGVPLPPDHGAPLRLVVPGWYGCTCIKWVNELRFVNGDEPATSQMIEFASRTHQLGTPELARDFEAAEIDVAAMPVRVEKWRVNGTVLYRVIGIEWGGIAPANGLEIRFGEGAWERVQQRDVVTSARSWRLWEHAWQPAAPGVIAITLRVSDPAIRTRRLDSGYYLREVSIEV